jgi:hypothetical protein
MPNPTRSLVPVSTADCINAARFKRVNEPRLAGYIINLWLLSEEDGDGWYKFELQPSGNADSLVPGLWQLSKPEMLK